MLLTFDEGTLAAFAGQLNWSLPPVFPPKAPNRGGAYSSSSDSSINPSL